MAFPKSVAKKILRQKKSFMQIDGGIDIVDAFLFSGHPFIFMRKGSNKMPYIVTVMQLKKDIHRSSYFSMKCCFLLSYIFFYILSWGVRVRFLFEVQHYWVWNAFFWV